MPEITINVNQQPAATTRSPPVTNTILQLTNLALLLLLLSPPAIWNKFDIRVGLLLRGDAQGIFTETASPQEVATTEIGSFNLPAGNFRQITSNLKESEARRKIAEVALAYARSGKNFKPGVSARCQDFVNYITEKAGWKIPSTKQPLDGEYVGKLMANRFAGPDIGQIITDPEQIQPGDIILYTDTYGNFRNYPKNGLTPDVTHVAIAINKDQIVDRGRRVSLRSIKTFKYRSGPKKGQWSFIAAVRPHFKFYAD